MSIKNKRYGKVEYLKADGIKAPHCFTTRIGGVSEATTDLSNKTSTQACYCLSRESSF